MRTDRPSRARLVPRLALGLLAFALACGGDDDGTDTVPPEQFRAIRLADTAPPLEADSIAFIARRGESTEAKMYFLNQQGERGNEFLAFKLDSNTLLERPDGTPFAPGDEVEISIKVVDPTRFIFEFAPAGLRFNPSQPAMLEVKYDFADRDFDEDGDEDLDDDEIEQILSLFRQERPGDPWVRIGTAVIDDLEEVEADILGFTRYAVAY